MRWVAPAKSTLRYFLLVTPMAFLAGSACALFLWSLDLVTRVRFDHPWLLFALPAAGLGVGLVYHYWGKSSEAGSNLLMDQIHEPGEGVPLRMAPLILFGTLVTHLFGGSAGREGTAVQMGGSIASAFAKALGLEPKEVRLLLMGGIAAGFGGVFGTPLAGAVFALEVLMIGRLEYEALLPCFIAAVAGDWGCHVWGVGHTRYHVLFSGNSGLEGVFKIDAVLLSKVVLAGALFGLGGALFSELSHGLSGFIKRKISWAPLRPFIGGLAVIAMTLALGSRDYLGLGVTNPDPKAVSIVSFFTSTEIHPWSWCWKILFTVVTLSSGFKGGEVTPLFFIGAALGNALAGLLGAPADLFAALGFVGIFAGATNTPLACALMGIELFGSANVIYIATACWLAYLFSGHSGIYLSQRVGVPKSEEPDVFPDMTLRSVRESRPNGIEIWTGLFRRGPEPEEAAGRPPEVIDSHNVHPREIGSLRIYLKPAERAPSGRGIRRLLGARPLYLELIAAARRGGLMNAMVHHTHHGFSRRGADSTAETGGAGGASMTWVEIVDLKEKLESFCSDHAEALRGKVITYKQIERWEILGGETHGGRGPAGVSPREG